MTTKVIVQPRITKITRIDGRVTKVVRSIAIAGGGEGGGVTQEYVDNGDAATLTSANLYADSAANAALASANAATALVEDDLNNLKQTVEDNLTLSYQYTDDAVTTINDSLALKADLVGGLVPAAQLPSFVDDVLEGTYINATTFNDEDGNKYTPESNKIYVDTTFNKSYRWSGSIYAPLDEGVVLGETSSTAYRGDRGKTAYDHSQSTGNPHGTSFSDLLSQSALFNLVYSAYVIGSNVAIAATDTLGEMLGKLQAQVNAKLDANANAVSATKLNTARNINGVLFDGTADISVSDSSKEPSIVAGTTAQYWRGDKTWRSFATDALGTVLTGLSTATATAVTATDTVLVGIGKLQAQVNALAPKTFDKTRWQSEDFLFDAGKFTFTQPAFGLASCLDNPNLLTSGCARLVADGLYGAAGFAKVESEVAILRKAGLLIRSIFVLDNTAFTHRTIGLSNVVGGTASPTVGVFLRCASTATNSYSIVAVNGGSATTVGTTTLPVNTILFMDMEWLTLTSVRVVVFDATNKYIDQTITTNLPTSAQKFCASINYVNTSSPILYLDYVGWGHTRPPEIVTPA